MNAPLETERLTLAEITVRTMEKGRDRTASVWFQTALADALARDPVDAANDAEALAEFLAWRAGAIARAVLRANLPR